jgi:small-conductance mechanosensitive channel
LGFEVLVPLAFRDNNGELEEEILSKLIDLFRPDREGFLTLLDFAKSVDTVYKELKMLRANVANASKARTMILEAIERLNWTNLTLGMTAAQLDRVFDTIASFVFYFALSLFTLATLGVNAFALLTSVVTTVGLFAFMMNIACSSWLNGMLLILVRRPFDVGDRYVL